MPKLGLRQKLGYGVADFGASLSYNTVNIFLFFFLVEVAQLRPALAGSVLLVGRVFDAVTDPLMGLVTDRTHTRWGRRMPYIWAGLLPLGASFVLLWLVPAGSQGLTFWLAALALCLHAALFTLVQVPYLALTPELAPDYDTRTELTSYRIGFGTLASLVAAAAPPLIVALLEPGRELAQTGRQGWLVMGLIFGLLISLAYLLMATSVREPRRPAPRVRPLHPLRDYLSAFGIYGFPQVLGLFVVVTLGLGVITSMLPFYLGSALELSATQQTLMLGLLFVTAIVALPIWGWLAARFGKRAAFAAGLALLSLSVVLLVTLAEPGLSAYLFAMTVLAGAGVSTVLLFPWAMLPDVVEFDELRTGRRREGLVYAIFTFGQKVAFSLGVFLNGQVQELTGYRPGAAEQSVEAVFGIKLMVGPVAALAFGLALVLVGLFPITRARHAAAMASLAVRQQGASGHR